MISFEERLNNSLNDNIDINIHASTLYNICKKGVKGFPQINYKFNKSFTSVFDFNDEVDELSAELYMSNLINSLITYVKDISNDNSNIILKSRLQQYFNNIPEVIIYQLSELYGLESFSNIFTKIEAGTSFVLPSLWSSYMTNSMKLSDLNNVYGEVDKCYNVNTVPVFKSFYKGDLDIISDKTISIKSYDNNISEGTETLYFKGYLRLPSDFMNKYSEFKEESVWQNNIFKKELQDTNGMSKSSITTTDNISIDTVSMYADSPVQSQIYKMLLETNIKKFIDKFISDNKLTVVSYGGYPYNKYIYQKPGDSKIIQSNKKTLLIDNKNVFLQDGSKIDVSGYIDCNAWKGADVRDAQYGRLFNYTNIEGWRLKKSSYKDNMSDTDLIT